MTTRGHESHPRTAIVLGGGGSKGAMQAGFYRAVRELGIGAEMVIAASIGALNGAFIAAGMPPRLMAEEWARVRRGDVFAFNWSLFRRGTRATSVYTARRLRAFLRERLPVETFEELPVRFVAVTTDLETGRPFLWDRGDLVEAIVASCSIPGIFPPVRGPGGRLLVDGALSDNIPVGTALERGAERVIGILCRTGPEGDGKIPGLPRLIGRTFGIATDLKWQLESARYEVRPEILIIDPENEVYVPALDFSRGDELCRIGYEASRPLLSQWLEVLSTPVGPAAESPADEDPERAHA